MTGQTLRFINSEIQLSIRIDVSRDWIVYYMHDKVIELMLPNQINQDIFERTSARGLK
ncbi:hypothetical protein MNV_2200003 [Candidatus Methanoperedens nitroreducens]|uniref:Uncharacterized protein n=1 Tax=Candidatus Methanoperedens nitratireducens TaxID=1392998 RepID=A0A284VPD5_9EURY|nr:hypothetical protein MNV_2200003 [Candidatus Methanoperedens nitroreducens]